MFDIYIKDFKRGGQTISTETKVQSIPATAENELKLISPVVKCDMGNAESFDFSIEGGTEFCDAFLQMKSYMRVVYDGSVIFMGRVLTVENGFRGTRKVHCEGPLAFFNDSPIKGSKEENRKSCSVYSYMSEIIANHNSWVKDSRRTFTLGEVPGNYTCSADQQLPNTERKYGQDGWSDTKAALEDLRSHYGGYFRVRCGAIGDPITLDWMNHYFNSSVISQTIEIGKNILDISNASEVDNIFTAIVPIGSNKETSQSGQDAHFCLDQVYVTVPEICNHFSYSDLNKGYHRQSDYASAIDRYGYIYKTVNFDDATTKEKLYNDACEWILNNYQGEVPKFTVKAIDMHQIGDTSVSKIMVGDRVKIIYPVVNEDGSVENRETYQTCINVQYDLYNPENNSYTFGIPANIMTKSYGLKKQTKKAATPTSTEPATTPSPGASSGGTKQTWIQKMKNWLLTHKIHYDGPKPYTEAYKANMHGPNSGDDRTYVYSEADHYFMSNKNFGDYWLWKATGTDHYMRPEEQAYYDQLKAVGATAQAEEFRSQCSAHSWKMSYHQVGAVTDSMITSFNLLQYIYEEYGLDFRGGAELNGTHMPEDVELEDGSSIHTIFDEDGNVVTQQIIESKGEHVTMDETGLEYIIFTDKDGKVHYYVKDKYGNWFETSNPRSLELMVADSDDFKGWLVRDGYASEIDVDNGKKYEYKFGLGIETNELGDNRQLVVARMDGDVVRIGSRRTEVSTVLARNVNGNWIHPYDVVVGTDGKKHLKYLDMAGTASYRGYYNQSTGEFIVDDQGDTVWTGTGIWDESGLALQGGIVTVQTGTNPDGTKNYTSYVKSDRLVIGDDATDLKVKDALLSSGVISEDEYGTATANALVAEEVYTKKINAIDADFKNIYTNYLKTSWITSSLGNIDLLNVKSIATSKTDNTGSCSFDNFYGDHYYVYVPVGGGSVSYVDLRYCFDKVEKTMSGNTVTLTFHRADGSISQDNPRTDQVSFDIATSLLGNWSGSASLPVLTVQDQAPVPHTYKIGFGENTKVDRRLDVTGNGTPTAYTNDEGKVVAKYLNVPIKVFEIDPPSGGNPPSLITRYAKTMTGVNGTVVYNQGWSGCYATKSVTTTGKSGSLGYGSQGSAKVTIKAGPDDKTGTTLLDISWVAPGDNRITGYNQCWGSYWVDPSRASGNLGYDESASIKIHMSNSDGRDVQRDWYYWTAPSNPTIDIPNGDIDTAWYEPSGTKLTNLKGAIKEAIDGKKFILFKVKTKNGSSTAREKQYYMDFR